MKNFLLSLLIMSVNACTVKVANEAKSNKELPASIPPKEAPSPSNSADPKNEVSDTLAIPVTITGAHLTCALRKSATDKSLESEIGCLLSDKESGKKIGADPKLSFSSSQPNLVATELQAEASIYHVIYRVKGESRDSILQTVQSLDAIAHYADKSFKVEKIGSVLKPAIELDDYEAPIVREQAIDKDEAGSL